MSGKTTSRRSGFWGFLQHLHPPSVHPRSLAPTTTFGLGLVSLYLFVLLLVTGVLLMIYYIPSVGSAYGSIQDIHAVVPFGGLVRSIHRWAGHAMVAVVGLHLLRTLLTGAYKGRARRGVWTAGVWLLLLTLAFAFTGYLLPWDQLSYWAVSIGGHLAGNVPLIGEQIRWALLGGDDVGEATLIEFYAIHVGLLPLITAILLVVHLFRLRRAGGLARPQSKDKGDAKERLPSWPHLYEREMALFFLVVAAVVIAGLLIEAPLGPLPDPAHPEDPSKAPWYFLFLQELVSYSALIGGVILPFLALLFLYLVPYLDGRLEGSGQWLAPKPARLVFTLGLVLGAGIVMGALLWHEGQDTSSANMSAFNPATALALGALLTGLAAFGIARWRKAPNPAQLVLLVLCGLGTAAVLVLTVIGVLRGPSWSLTLPWGLG